MNFSLSGGGIGLIGGFILFGALLLAVTIVVTIVGRVLRGRDEAPVGSDEPGRRREEDDLV